MYMKQSVTAICQSVFGVRATATLVTALVLAAALPASASTIDRIKETGQINLGYIADGKPFTYSASGGTPEGYGAELCEKIVERAKTQLSLGQLKANWVPVTKA